MKMLVEEYGDLKDAMNTWLSHLAQARDEGVTKRNLGYLTANPEWIDHALRVIEDDFLARNAMNTEFKGSRWERSRLHLWSLRDDIRHFHDADLSWSETLTNAAPLRELYAAMDVYSASLQRSDSDLDSRAEGDFIWTR